MKCVKLSYISQGYCILLRSTRAKSGFTRIINLKKLGWISKSFSMFFAQPRFHVRRANMVTWLFNARTLMSTSRKPFCLMICLIAINLVLFVLLLLAFPVQSRFHVAGARAWKKHPLKCRTPKILTSVFFWSVWRTLPLVSTSLFSRYVAVRLDTSSLLSWTSPRDQSARSTPEYFQRRSLCSTLGFFRGPCRILYTTSLIRSRRVYGPSHGRLNFGEMPFFLWGLWSHTRSPLPKVGATIRMSYRLFILRLPSCWCTRAKLWKVSTDPLNLSTYSG